jgi:fermentation-respiration switch protein FrsA (DUF1100 family)
VDTSRQAIREQFRHRAEQFDSALEHDVRRCGAELVRLADRLAGSLLLIHGTSDINAPFSATMKMVEALTRAGKPYDLIVLPGDNHSFAGERRRYWRQAIRRYFETHLCPACTGPDAGTPRAERD